MKNNILFHGSNVTVSKPKILINGYYKDFGYGFYCKKSKNRIIRINTGILSNMKQKIKEFYH